jgi:very-short-patch-repair endonuclease
MKYTNTQQANASKIHRKILDYFKRERPEWDITQEHPIKINGKTLFCDFMSRKPFRFVLEIHGRQHFEFVPHFHGTMAKFAEQQANDEIKRSWCEMNGYKLIEIREDEFDEAAIGSLILGALCANEEG